MIPGNHYWINSYSNGQNSLWNLAAKGKLQKQGKAELAARVKQNWYSPT